MNIEAAPQGVVATFRRDREGFSNQNDKSKESFVQKSQDKSSQSICSVPVALCNKLLGNIKYQIFITILTIYSLFSDDFRTAIFDAKVDMGFDIVSLIIMSIFAVQIILSCLVVDKYFLSFFFFLDIISTISMIFDVNFITDDIFDTTTSSSVTQLANQSKASRAATRAVRIVKLFRIIRIIKLFKNAQKARQIKQQNKQKQIMKEKLNRRKDRNKNLNSEQREVNLILQKSLNTMLPEFNKPATGQTQKPIVQKQEQMNQHVYQRKDSEQINQEQLQNFIKKESKIGRILSELSMKKIIVVVLLIMFIVPLLSIQIYSDVQNAWDFSLVNQKNILMTSQADISQTNMINLIQKTMKLYNDQQTPLIQYTTPFKDLPYVQKVDLNVLRNQDLISSTEKIQISTIMANRPTLQLRTDATDPDQLSALMAILDQSYLNRVSAYFSMAKTLFVCIVLLVMMGLFANDIDTLLVEPIEGMMEKLMNMAKDPESAAKQQLSLNVELETTIISNAIIKIGALLSIVFGSAGAQIIGTNIVGEGSMNPMIEGKKKCAIFGFCDIRHFTEVTQVLQQEILVFVNKIGSLVHESVYRYGGSANKNIGQAFLLVWKIPQDLYVLDNKTNQIEWKKNKELNVLADFAVLGFVKTLIKIHKDPFVLQYATDPRLKSKMPDFKVQMGFGLHVGWAIEGAIGSEYKIDASYLSPNVNMASRLQAATKQFGVDFLLSESLYDLLTPDMKEFCRNIDRVTVKGSQKPIKLYTLDLNYQRITPPMNKQLKYPNPQDRPDGQSKRALNMQWLKEDVNNFNARIFIESKKEMTQVLINSVPEDFRKRFDLGVRCYLKGKWGDARLHLSQALKFKASDGPTKTLLSYMKKFNFAAPNDWKNYRQLTSK